MPTSAQVADALDAAAPVVGGVMTAVAPLIPGTGIGAMIAGVVQAGFALGAALARAGHDPVAAMQEMQSAIPAWEAAKRRADATTAAFIRGEPGEGE